MDPVLLVSALMAARIGQMQLAIAGKIALMQADSGDAATKLVAAVDASMKQLSAAAQGIGQNIDISV